FTHYASRLTIYHVIIVVNCHLPINIEGIRIAVSVHRVERICHSRMFWAGIHSFSDQWMPDKLVLECFYRVSIRA
ncbi:hypothetical protein JW964_14445, partial [candidate division KSB1 bacterium]|nr:hypothetical protein [candidate division KSB1 bacterium]